MKTYLHNISQTVPEIVYEQKFLREKMKEYLSNKEKVKKVIHRIYSNSGISRRYSVVDDFYANGDPRLFFQKKGDLSEPSTGDRNSIYTEKARTLFVKVAKQLLDDHPCLEAGDITHVITVSCTGFFAPGPAFEIVKQLKMNPSTQRFHLGFMGCYAAFPALKMAKAFCESDKNAVVMIVCLELCSLHFQASESLDSLISASLFADGGAGALVSAKRPPKGIPFLRMDAFATSVAAHSESDMAWTIGDSGFDMVLSTYVPEIIKANLTDAIKPLMENLDIDFGMIDHWAIHPGGRAILDKTAENFNLEPEKLNSSRTILSNYGNMSSATILFVLNHLLSQHNDLENTTEHVLAMAFGPGLTIESGLFTKMT